MNLFIETPQRAAERIAREHERQLRELKELSSQQRFAVPSVQAGGAAAPYVPLPTDGSVGGAAQGSSVPSGDFAVRDGAMPGTAAQGGTRLDAAASTTGVPADPSVSGIEGFGSVARNRRATPFSSPDASPYASPKASQPQLAPAFAQAEAAFPGGDEYWKERAFDRARQRRGKVWRIARVLLFILLIPVALVVVFVAAYALTCIMNGASPSELVEMLSAMAARTVEFVREALG